MTGKTLRASEIGTYLFCRRAWWYSRQGYPATNVAALQAGRRWHRRHGRRVLTIGCLRALGYALLLAAVVTAAVHLTLQILG